MRSRLRRLRPRKNVAAGFILSLLIALLVLPNGAAGAVSPHYERMANQKLAGVALGCADLRYAAAHALIDPVEVHWLDDLGIRCPNKQYVIMLVLGERGQLSCADVEWNAAYGRLNRDEAADLLYRVPGCVLSQYARLVSIATGEGLSCTDVNWHADQGLVSPEQAGWLRAALVAHGVACAPPSPPPPTAPPAPTNASVVAFRVTPGAFCATADAGKYGYTVDGVLMRCVLGAPEPRYRWRAA